MSTNAADSPRKASSNNLNRQAGLYSLAAAAAGVSVLALASPATAEVVVTKTHLSLTGGTGLNLDLNHDGVTDFAFSIFNYQDFSPSFRATFNMSGVGGGGIVGSPVKSNFYASALVRGAKIGPSAHFSPTQSAVIERSFGDAISSHTTFRTLKGDWGNDPQNRYLGVRFLIDGETHYGWIRLNVTSSNRAFSLSATITGYAYETIPNKPILAGTAEKPTAEVQLPKNIVPENIVVEKRKNQGDPSLGMLALGAHGLPLWRREESSALR